MPQTAGEVIVDVIMLTTKVILPQDTQFGRAKKFAHERMLCIYDTSVDDPTPEAPKDFLLVAHVNRSIRMFLLGYAADGLHYPAPRYIYPETRNLIVDFVQQKAQFCSLIRSCIYSIFCHYAKAHNKEASLNAIFSDGYHENPQVFNFFAAKDPGELTVAEEKKFDTLYGLKMLQLRHYITLMGSSSIKTPSLPWEDFLPPAAAMANRKRFGGATKPPPQGLQFDLDAGFSSFSGDSFSARFFIDGQNLHMFTNISISCLQSGSIVVSESGNELNFCCQIPTGLPSPVDASSSSTSSASSANDPMPPSVWHTTTIPVPHPIACDPPPQIKKSSLPGWTIFTFNLLHRTAIVFPSNLKD